MEATPELGTIPPLILTNWTRPAFRSGFFLMLQIDSANTSIACMGNTKNQVQAHLREAWLAVPAAQRKERLEPLLAYQTKPDNIVTLAAERGLPQEQLPAMPFSLVIRVWRGRWFCWSFVLTVAVVDVYRAEATSATSVMLCTMSPPSHPATQPH